MFQVGQTANCFDSYLFRAPLPRKLVDLQAIGFPMGGQWGTENAWVVELRAAGISVYTPKCGIFKLVHYHCSQARPNQKGEIMPSRIKLRSDRVCFEAICQSTCVRETVPSDDLITKVRWCWACCWLLSRTWLLLGLSGRESVPLGSSGGSLVDSAFI